MERKVIRLRELNANFEGFEIAKQEETLKIEEVEEPIEVEKPPTPQGTKKPDPKKGQAGNRNNKVVEEAPKEEEVKEEVKEPEILPPRTIESDLENFMNPERNRI